MSSSSSAGGGKYTRDLKLRVLEHYFRNGGDVFGNKQSTAKKFGIDSKTINRFLKIHELVRVARKNARSRKSAATSSSGGFKTPLVPGTGGSSSSRTRAPVRQTVRITLPTQPDESIVNQTASGNTSSIGKLLKIFELGTQEIRDLLAAECDLIYECRVCRGLFRSVANLLSHKRRFCTRPAADTRRVFGDGPGQSLAASSDGVLVLPLAETIDRLPEVRQAAAVEARAAAAQPLPAVRLEPLPGTGAAVFQTVGNAPSVADQVMEVHQLEAAAGRTVRLGRDGRVVEDGEEETGQQEEAEHGDDGRHVCQHCNTTFSTRKTLSHHVRSLHSSTRIYYPCCLCSAAFINMFSVERHLQKVHKKRQEEIDVLKEGIKQKSFHRSVTEAQAVTPSISPNMPKKVVPSPAGLLRCCECSLTYPSVQLLAAHQLTAHAPAGQRAASGIRARRDYLESPPPPPPREAIPASGNGEMEAKVAALSDLKRMRCRQCGSVQKTVHNLRRHIAAHIGWTRHGCPLCQFRAFSRHRVAKHMRRDHGMAHQKAEALLEGAQRQRTAAAAAGAEKSPPPSVRQAAAKTYQMRDLSSPRHAPPPKHPSYPPSHFSVPTPFQPRFSLPRPARVPPVSPVGQQTPPSRARRRGRRTLSDVIHYIWTGVGQPGGRRSPRSPCRPPSWSGGPDPATELTTAAAQQSADDDPTADDDDEAADGDAGDDDDLASFLSPCTGAELEPGVVWRVLPPRSGDAQADTRQAPAEDEQQRQLSRQHDHNENIQPVSATGSKAGAEAPQGPSAPGPLSGTDLPDGCNLFPRVLLTDIALRRCNSSPTPARPASPGGGAVYPAGARLDPAGPPADGVGQKKWHLEPAGVGGGARAPPAGRAARSSSAPGRVAAARRPLLSPTAASPPGRAAEVTSTPANRRRTAPSALALQSRSPAAAAAASTHVPVVRKRSWSNPTDPPETAPNSANTVAVAAAKRRRYRRSSDRAVGGGR